MHYTVTTITEDAGISATYRHRQPRKMDGSGAERLDNAAVTWEWSHKNRALKIR